MRQDGKAALAALEARIARDLALIRHPAAPWVKPKFAPDGTRALDVLIVGAGQSGIAVGFCLKRMQVNDILAVDKAPYGREGPWETYARMHTLRSPKDFTGPDLDVPSLTYRCWHEATYGEAHWERLDLIAKEDWNRYLLFVRRVTGVPVRNETALVAIAPAGDLLAATLEGPDGREIVHARRIVLATGQDSVGRWHLPEALAGLPAELVARTADPIDFGKLEGKVVAVIGAGASALDNAACALEAGAAAVHLLCRRAEVQVVQPYRWLTFRGFLKHMGELDDATRWRFMSRILGMREGFPQATWDRCAAHERFHLHTGSPVRAARLAEGRALLDHGTGTLAADLVIACTGVAVDYAARPELAACADAIATWGDRYDPPEGMRDARLARFPYLGPDFSFQEKQPGRAPWISRLHLFSIASTMSFGPSGSSINAMTTAVPKLVDGITRALFAEDIEAYWEDLCAYDVPQAVLARPSWAEGYPMHRRPSPSPERL